MPLQVRRTMPPDESECGGWIIELVEGDLTIVRGDYVEVPSPLTLKVAQLERFVADLRMAVSLGARFNA